LSCFAVSKNENVIVSANPRRIALWKPGTQLAVFDQVHHTSRVVVSDNELFVAGLSHGATNLWVINVATKKLRVLLQGPHFTSVRFFPDDALVAAGDSDGVVRIFDTRSGEQLVAVGCGKSIMALATATNLIGATYGDYPFARAVPTGNWSMWAIQTTTGGMQLRSIK
jgi:WD40 repeat protein